MAQVPLAFEDPGAVGHSVCAPSTISVPEGPSTVTPSAGMARCGACRSFQRRSAAPPAAIDGWCARFHVETCSAPLFTCEGYVPADAAAVALHRRRVEVVRQLKAEAGVRYAWDVLNATPAGPAPGEVSVMLGIRWRDGLFLTGVLRIPGERWDMGAFLAAFGALGTSPAGAAQ